MSTTLIAEEIKALLAKYPQLFTAHLEMRNDLIEFKHVLMRIRELLSHEMHDLRKIVGLSHPGREALGESQELYAAQRKVYKNDLEGRFGHAMGRLDKHMVQIQAKIDTIGSLIPNFDSDLSTMHVSLNKLLQYPSHDIGPLASLVRRMNDRTHRLMDNNYTDLHAEYTEQLKPYLSEFAGFVKNHMPKPHANALVNQFREELDYFCNGLFSEITTAAQYSEGIRQKRMQLALQFKKSQLDLELEEKLGLNFQNNKIKQPSQQHSNSVPRPSPFIGLEGHIRTIT